MTDAQNPYPPYQQPQQAPQYPAAQPAVAERPRRNTVGLIALIVAVVGFIFACVPGALIVGWVLLPISFVLALVSLFMKGKKGLGVTALVLSIVGTVVGVIVFFAVVATAFDDAFGGADSSVVETTEEQPAAEQPAEEPATEEQAADAGAAVGSRENPATIGSTITGDEWSVVVNSFTADATQVVAAANQFNDPAPAGSHYSTVNYTVTYTGAESDIGAMVGISLVTDTGEVLENYDSLVVLEDGMGLDELYNGGSATGSAAFTVPDGANVLVRVRPGMFADEIFVQP